MEKFVEKERACQRAFENGGPFWHLYTSGRETPLLFREKSDFEFVMNVIAQMADRSPDVRVIAFTVMGNHQHIVAAGLESALKDSFEYIRRRLARDSISKNGEHLPCGFYAQFKMIENLQALRATIAYVHRNGYVAHSAYTPFSYPWGTGPYYFGFPVSHNKSFCELSKSDRRIYFRSREPALPGEWQILDKYVCPQAYCKIEMGESMFRDARQYFSMLTKNVESYAELAVELDDREYLTDAEIFTQLTEYVKKIYGTVSLKELSRAQTLDIARKMHSDWRSSNGQIRRILNLSQYEINALFPQPQG